MELSDDKLIELFESVAGVSVKVEEVYNRLIGDGNKKGEIDKLNDCDSAILAELKDIRIAVRQLDDRLVEEKRTREDAIKKIGDTLYDHNIEVRLEKKLKVKQKTAIWGLISLAGGGIYKIIELAVDLWLRANKGGK